MAPTETRRRRLARRSRAVVGCCLLGALSCACSNTEFFEREKLDNVAMRFDADDGFVTIRNKTESAREGAFGGFGAATAGGCPCN